MKVCSIFSQVLKLFLAPGIREGGQGAQGRAARAGFHQLGQFMAMLFCQLGRALIDNPPALIYANRA
jgi:hypothetical protein